MTTVDRAIAEYRAQYQWRRAVRNRLLLGALAVSLVGDVLVMAVLVTTGVNLLH